MSKYVIVFLLSAITLASGVWYIYHAGQNNVQAKWNLEKVTTERRMKELEAKSAVVNTEIVTKYVDRVKTVKIKGDTIVKYVDRYITPEIDKNYPVPNIFVRLHNDAAANNVPSAASADDDRPSEIKISEVTSAVTQNYTTCNLWREEVIVWHEWYNKQSKLFNESQKN